MYHGRPVVVVGVGGMVKSMSNERHKRESIDLLNLTTTTTTLNTGAHKQ